MLWLFTSSIVFPIMVKRRNQIRIDSGTLAAIPFLIIFVLIILLVDSRQVDWEWTSVMAPFAILFPLFIILGAYGFSQEVFGKKSTTMVYLRSYYGTTLDFMSIIIFFGSLYCLLIQPYLSEGAFFVLLVASFSALTTEILLVAVFFEETALIISSHRYSKL